MQRCSGNGSSGKTYRVDYYLRRQHAGAANLNNYVAHAAFLAFRRILESYSPTRSLCRAAESFALCKTVDLDNSAIHFIRQFSPVLTEPFYALHAVVYIVIVHIRNDGETHIPHCIQSFGVSGIFVLRGKLHIEEYYIQLARCGDFGIKLAHGTGGGVARVCKKLLAVYLSLSVELFKHRL